MTNPLKILQCNMARRKPAMDLLRDTALRFNVDVCIVAEPNRVCIKSQNWISDSLECVSIKSFSSVSVVKSSSCHENFVVLELSQMVIYGCYISPNCSLSEFEHFLDRLARSVRVQTKECVIAGDFNSKAKVFGSHVDDKRGMLLVDWLAELNLIIHNRGNASTFVRGDYGSVIDLTLSTEKIARAIRSWKVLDDETLSDHNYIFFVVDPAQALLKSKSMQLIFRGWRTENLVPYLNRVGWELRRNTDSLTPESLTEICVNCCNKSLPRKVFSERRPPNYWWTKELTHLRKTCLSWKRKLSRSNKKSLLVASLIDEMRRQYRKSRQVLKNEIFRAKKFAWKKICEDVDNDIWGLGYRIAMKKLKSPLGMFEPSKQLQIVEELFPKGPPKIFIRDEHNTITEFPAVTVEEIESACQKIKCKTAAGPDFLAPEIVKATALLEPQVVCNLFNNLLRSRTFPKNWKEAKLVLIEKPNKGGGEAKFRPISLLSVWGKLFEHIITCRLMDDLENRNVLYDYQFGFRRNRSTVDALNQVRRIVERNKLKAPNNRDFLMLITLDIRNAFNTVPWGEIMKDLCSANVPNYLLEIINDYLSDRKLKFGNSSVDLSCGVPQGSKLGPSLWIISYDCVLRTEMPEGVVLIGYADDTAIVVSARSKEQLINNANTAILKLVAAINRKGLQIAPEKTELVILYGGLRLKDVEVVVENVTVKSQSTIKYLGVTIDQGFSMTEQINVCAHKAEKAVNMIQGLMPKIGGPKASTRKLLASVAHSIILYACPVWFNVLRKTTYVNKLVKVQRRMALRVCSGFRTMSTEAAQVIAGIPPIDLLVNERCAVYNGDTDNVGLVLDRWQERWEKNTGKAVWTKTLIPDVAQWCQRRHGDVDFYTTQLLSGHGYFGHYGKRFKIINEDLCPECKTEDTAEHTFFFCERWNNERQKLVTEVNCPVTSNNIVEIMLRDEHSWTLVTTLAKSILSKKTLRQ